MWTEIQGCQLHALKKQIEINILYRLYLSNKYDMINQRERQEIG